MMFLLVVLTLLVLFYALIWGFCLIHCLVKKKFYPVFGSGWGTKLFWLFTFVFFNPILTLFYIIFAVIGRTSARPSLLRTAVTVVPVLAIVLALEIPSGKARGPVTRERDPETGEIVEKGGRRKGVRFSVRLFQGRSGMNTTTVKTTSRNPRFSCKHVVIFGGSHSRFLEKVGIALEERLSRFEGVEQITYLPEGKTPPRGELAPDLFVSLDLDGMKRLRLPLYCGIRTTVLARAGNLPHRPTYHVTDSRTPPEIEFEWRSSIDHKSRLWGYESAGAKDASAAEDIANDIAKSLKGLLADYYEEHGPMPDLPAAMYGTYREPPDLPFLSLESAKLVAADYGLMRHCRATWVYEDDRDTTAALRSVRDRMEAAGWETRRLDARSRFSAHLRMTSGSAQLLVFRERRPTPSRTVMIRDRKRPKPPPMVAIYEERFSDEEIDAALEALLESDASTDALLMFESFLMNPPWRARFMAQLETRPARSPEDALALARVYTADKRNDDARAALIRALALLRTRMDYSRLQREVEKQAKEIGEKDLVRKEIPESVFRDLGFVELTTATQRVEREVAVNQPILVYRKHEGKIRTVSLFVVRDPRQEKWPPYALRYVAARGGSRSSATRGGELNGSTWLASTVAEAGGLYLDVEAQSDDGKTFQVRVTIIP